LNVLVFLDRKCVESLNLNCFQTSLWQVG